MVLYITHLILFTCMDVNWELSIEREQNPGRLQNGRHAEKNLESRWSASQQPGISGTRLNQFTTKPGAQPSRVIIPQGVFMWLISSDHLESSRHATGGVLWIFYTHVAIPSWRDLVKQGDACKLGTSTDEPVSNRT
jgi:hypothetical protein